jgi:hypothetical protein
MEDGEDKKVVKTTDNRKENVDLWTLNKIAQSINIRNKAS